MILSSNGGLGVFNCFWEECDISCMIDGILPKFSGNSCSSILKNLVVGKVIGCDSLISLCDETKKEWFLSSNSRIDRTNYSRNMNKIDYYKQNTILRKAVCRAVDVLKLGKRARRKGLQVLDASALQVTGETFEGASWVYDSRVDSIVWGFEVLTSMVKIGKRCFPVRFRTEDQSKYWIVQSFEQGRVMFGIDDVAFDAGFRGMGFYKELDNKCFNFYTKATMNWWWDFHSFKKQTKEFLELAEFKFRRNYKYVDFIVEKEIDEGKHKGEIMKLRLVVVKGDKRVFLTNEFKSTPKKIFGKYQERWSIEEMFKEEKQNLAFEKLTVRKKNAIRTHIMTALLAFTFCQLMLAKFPSIKGIKLLVRKIIKNIAQIIKTTKGIIIKFTGFFDYRLALEKFR